MAYEKYMGDEGGFMIIAILILNLLVLCVLFWRVKSIDNRVLFLTKLQLEPHDVVETRGFFSEGDGGGAIYDIVEFGTPGSIDGIDVGFLKREDL